MLVPKRGTSISIVGFYADLGLQTAESVQKDHRSNFILELTNHNLDKT